MGSQQRPVAGFNDDIGLETQSIPFADVLKLRRPRIPVDAKGFHHRKYILCVLAGFLSRLPDGVDPLLEPVDGHALHVADALFAPADAVFDEILQKLR